MKKVLSLVAAGAMLLSVTGVAFAYPHHSGSTVTQTGSADSTTFAVSNSGLNGQFGGGSQSLSTGTADSAAVSLTGGDVNVGKGSGTVTQTGSASSLTVAGSNSGLNGQVGGSPSGHHHSSSSQSLSTGGTTSFAGSATVANVSVGL